MTETLFLVRHGEAEGTGPGVLLGRTDAHLSDNGRQQSALLRGVVPVTPAARLVSSPLARARETAAIAVAGSGAPDGGIDVTASAGADAVAVADAVTVDAVVEIDPDLREIDFGDWEGLKFEQIEREYPALVKAWSEFSLDFAFPHGEALADFAARVERVARRLATTDSDTVIAFTHGGVIRALICHFLGLPLRDYLLFDITPASVTMLRLWGERGVLAGLRPGESLSGQPLSWVWRRSS